MFPMSLLVIYYKVGENGRNVARGVSQVGAGICNVEHIQE